MPETMTDPRQLLVHELGDIYYAEGVLAKALPALAEEARDEELRAGFDEHAEETHQQIQNLRLAFEELGEKPQSERCPAIEGIRQEHDEFIAGHDTSDEIRDLFLTGAGGRTEHYEIAAYSGLITMARALRETRVALKKLETCASRLALSASPNGTSA